MLVFSGLVANFRRNGQKGGQSGKKIPPSLTLTQNSTVLQGRPPAVPQHSPPPSCFCFIKFFHVFLVFLRVPAFCSVRLCGLWRSVLHPQVVVQNGVEVCGDTTRWTGGRVWSSPASPSLIRRRLQWSGQKVKSEAFP